MGFPVVQSDSIGGFGGKTYYSTAQMKTPDNSPHVRSVEFRLPLLGECPSVSHQIASVTNNEPVLAYALKINQNVGGDPQFATQIAIEAVTLSGKPTYGTYYCSITVVEPPSRELFVRSGIITVHANQPSPFLLRFSSPLPRVPGKKPVAVVSGRNNLPGANPFDVHMMIVDYDGANVWFAPPAEDRDIHYIATLEA